MPGALRLHRPCLLDHQDRRHDPRLFVASLPVRRLWAVDNVLYPGGAVRLQELQVLAHAGQETQSPQLDPVKVVPTLADLALIRCLARAVHLAMYQLLELAQPVLSPLRLQFSCACRPASGPLEIWAQSLEPDSD